MKKTLIVALALLAGCGPEPQPQQPDTLPTPSGPPLAQGAAPRPVQPAPVPMPQWESVVSNGATALRLVEGGEVRMTMACLEPNRLEVEVPGFTPISSEDRFSLGLGEEPVTLVADLRRTNGVVAEAPVPGNLEELLERAKQITALYGTQRIGPVAVPPSQLVTAFSETCREL